MNQPMKELIIASRNCFFIKGLQSFLATRRPELNVFLSAKNEDTLKLIHCHPEAGLLIETYLEDGPSFNLFAQLVLHKKIPDFTVVLLDAEHIETNHGRWVVLTLHHFGIKYLITKEELSETLVDLFFQHNHKDAAYHSPMVGYQFKLARSTDHVLPPDLHLLSDSERRFLTLYAENRSIEETAGKLYISKSTAKNHRANICSKLNLKKSEELTDYMIKYGLIKSAQINSYKPFKNDDIFRTVQKTE
jgi:DNA-binding NarL/FixJ family response regulator